MNYPLSEFTRPGKEKPIWFMRQAGRYLPEYRSEREKQPNFIHSCYDKEFIVAVTKQPLERFNIDFGIIFSDILVILDMLGVKVEFKKNMGPSVETNFDIDISKLNTAKAKPIYEAISEVSNDINPKPLIGFAGGVFTVLCYAIGNKPSQDSDKIRSFIYHDRPLFDRCIKTLVEATKIHLSKQIESGAKIIQIFDSWAGLIGKEMFDKYIIKPTAEIVHYVKDKHPEVKIIGFPRLCGEKYIDYAKETKVDGISIDYLISRKYIRNNLPEDILIQGNLDPMLLIKDNDYLENEIKNILDDFYERKFIFNLGHGFTPETKIELVQKTVEIVKKYRK